MRYHGKNKNVAENLRNFHTVQRTLWKLRNFTATIFSQKFRQINFLLKKFTLNCFDGKKIAWQRFFCFSTLCWVNFTKNYCSFHIKFYLAKVFFVKSNLFNSFFLVKTLFSRKFCKKSVRVNLREKKIND